MMRLQDKLPEGVTVDGKFYKCDFDFRNVLEMMHTLSRNDLIDSAREYNALKCVMKHPRNTKKVLAAVKALLFTSKPQKDAQKLTDFEQDAGMIRAAFKQSYGVDLYRDRMHWIEFRELLNALPQGSRYAEVVGIRARPIPAPNKYNQSEIAWLVRAKADVALEVPEEERKANYDKQVQNIFTGLLAWANSFEKKDSADKGSE